WRYGPKNALNQYWISTCDAKEDTFFEVLIRCDRVVAGELRAQRGSGHAARGLARPAVRPGPDRPRTSLDGRHPGRRPRTLAADLRPRLARSRPARGVRRVRPGTGRTRPGRRGNRPRARPGPVPADGGRRPGDRLRRFRAAAR